MRTYIEDTSIEARIAEIEWKAGRLREAMARKGWAAVIINKSQNFAWITAGCSNIVTRYAEAGICSIMITRDRRYFLCNNIETQRMLDEERLEELGFEALTTMWYEDMTVARIKSVIGDGRYASDIALKGAEDANSVVLDMEYVLCSNEIGRYQELGRKFIDVIEPFMLTIKQGEVEEAAAGRLGARMWENGLDPVLYLVAGDERIKKYRHCIPTKNRIDKVVLVSCNCRYKGLITKITRMLYFGKAPEELMEQYRKNIEIENRMIAMTRPGVDDKDIFDSAKRFYEEAGYPDMWKLHHQGGPQSYNNGFYLMNDEVHRVVKLNECYGYNPSITGTKTEDCFIVGEDGPLFITSPKLFPKLESNIDGINFVRPGLLEL